MAKKKQAAPAVETMNAAPGYDPYARGPAPPASGVTAPGGPYGAPPNGAGAAATMGPPPARADQSEFINATFLWKFGRPIRATILGVRDATGTGRAEFQTGPKANKRAWFIDFKLEAQHPDTHKDTATGRINEGDTRHQRLWAAFQGNMVGRAVTLRLTTPGDIDTLTGKPSKAAWMLDAQ